MVYLLEGNEYNKIMKKTLKKSLVLITALFVIAPAVAFAHQPRIVENAKINVTDAEISKAYYGQLEGESHIYTINSLEDFELYVNILVPDIEGQEKDVSLEIFKNGESIKVLDANSFEWTNLFEPFGYDTYWMGPEYKTHAEAGEYEVRVWSTNNDSKYSLVIGEIEAFNFKETLNALKIIPQLKKDFFNKSPINFILSPFGWGLIIIMYILAFIAGFIYRSILKKFAKGTARGVHKNIGKGDRLIRLAIWLGLLLWAITTTWSPILLFFSGFTLFEAIFSWCGFYAAIGKNNCPL